MNNLEQYRDKIMKEAGPEAAYGFNAAIGLDLPVFFYDWLDGEFLNTDDACCKLQCADTAELYRYWIDNIFKPE